MGLYRSIPCRVMGGLDLRDSAPGRGIAARGEPALDAVVAWVVKNG